MTDTVAILLLAIVELAGLLMVPLGLPGLWVMIMGLLGYGWFTDFQTVGFWTTTLVLALALLGEFIETWLGFRFALMHELQLLDSLVHGAFLRSSPWPATGWWFPNRKNAPFSFSTSPGTRPRRGPDQLPPLTGVAADWRSSEPVLTRSLPFSPRESSKSVSSGAPQDTPQCSPVPQNECEQTENARAGAAPSASVRSSGRKVWLARGAGRCGCVKRRPGDVLLDGGSGSPLESTCKCALSFQSENSQNRTNFGPRDPCLTYRNYVNKVRFTEPSV